MSDAILDKAPMDGGGTASILPIGALQRKSLGWSGIKTAIATEAALFVFLLFCYYYYDVQLDGHWRPSAPNMKLALPNTVILLVSSVAVWLSERALRRDKRGLAMLAVAAAIVLGAAFVAIQGKEWASQSFTMHSSLYGSIYFTTTGFHMVHVVVGLVGLSLILLWIGLGYFDARRHAGVIIASAYWHFVDAVWIAVFFTYYITPRLW